jgi:nucleoside-diphosphate-sugar epimerase
VNVDGTRRRAQEAAVAGVRRFVYLSSAKAATPDDAYGRTKLAAERALARVSGLEVVVLRPPLVYGPGVRANFLGLMRAVDRGWPLPLASVRNLRSVVYLGNLVDAIVRCLEAPQAAGKIYPVSDGDPVSTPELVRAIARALGRPARLLPFPASVLDWFRPLRSLARSLEVDDSAIRRELGWRPPYTFEQGLCATAEWYRAQGR